MTDRQKYIQACRHTGRNTDKHVDRQTETQAVIQVVRQDDEGTDRQTDEQKRPTDRLKYCTLRRHTRPDEDRCRNPGSGGFKKQIRQTN